jgi:ketosteroid isomerase-like protein
MPAAPTTPEIQLVKELWDAFEDGGVARVMERAGDGVEWQPSTARGRRLRGTKEAMDFFAEQDSKGISVHARPYRYEQHGSCVIVTGSLRIREHGGFSETSRVWLFRFENGRLKGAEQYASHAEALAACDAA